MELSIEEIQKKFDSLPEDLKWAIMAANADQKITEIGKNYELNVAQMGQLSLETHAVMLGFTHPEKFEESVKASLGLPEEKIGLIIRAVNEKILKGIKEKVLALYGKKPEEESDKESAPAKVEPTAKPEVRQEEEEEKVLKSAGIEIQSKREQKEIKPSLSSQKLGGSFQMPASKQEHSEKNSEKPKENTGQESTEIPKKDPYREEIT